MANENEKPIHNIAIASLACAILGIFLFGIIAGAAAIGLGFYAKSQIEKGNGRGLKMALSGIWAGVVVLALSLLGMLIEEPEVVVAPTPVDTWPGLAKYIFDSLISN